MSANKHSAIHMLYAKLPIVISLCEPQIKLFSILHPNQRISCALSSDSTTSLWAHGGYSLLLDFYCVIYQQKQFMCILENHFMDGTGFNKYKNFYSEIFFLYTF